MKILNWDEFYTRFARVDGITRHQQAHEELIKTHPVYFTSCTKVSYDAKADRYTGSFYSIGDRTDTVKLSDEAAEFLLANRELRRPDGSTRTAMVYLKLEKGTVVDVLLAAIS